MDGHEAKGGWNERCATGESDSFLVEENAERLLHTYDELWDDEWTASWECELVFALLHEPLVLRRQSCAVDLGGKLLVIEHNLDVLIALGCLHLQMTELVWGSLGCGEECAYPHRACLDATELELCSYALVQHVEARPCVQQGRHLQMLPCVRVLEGDHGNEGLRGRILAKCGREAHVVALCASLGLVVAVGGLGRPWATVPDSPDGASARTSAVALKAGPCDPQHAAVEAVGMVRVLELNRDTNGR